jgi:WhiB family transcriptional regulator, redox-sensing transcriptional regulator
VDPAWWLQVLCTGLTPLFYATDPTSKRPAVAVCMTCPVGESCLADAQATEVGWRIYGERGGLTAEQRQGWR